MADAALEEVEQGAAVANEAEGARIEGRRRPNPNPWNVTYDEVVQALRLLPGDPVLRDLRRMPPQPFRQTPKFSYTGTEIAQWLRRNHPQKYKGSKVPEIRSMVLRYLVDGMDSGEDISQGLTRDRYKSKGPY